MIVTLFIKYFNKNSKRFFIFSLFVLAYYLIDKLPYMNLILSDGNYMVFFLTIPFLLIFRPSQKSVVLISFVIIGLGMLLSLLSADGILELYGSALFIIFIYIFLINICGLEKQENQEITYEKK
jgi:hypothetical protein